MLLCSIGAVVSAQELNAPGMIARLDLTQRLEYSDNPDFNNNGNNDLFGRTLLNFSLLSETKSDRFQLNLGTQIEEGRAGKSNFDLRNNSVNLGYRRDTSDAFVNLSLRFHEADNDQNVTDNDFNLDSNVIDQDGGTRRTYGLGINGAFRQDEPISASYRLNYSKIDYSNTTNRNLTDRSTLNLSGRVQFRFDQRIIGRLTAKYIDFDTEGNGVDRETTGVGAGVRLEVTPRLTADIELGYDRIERRGNETGTDDGLRAAIDLQQAMLNGSLGLSFETNVSSNDDGRRSSLRLTRELNPSRLSSLFISAGVTRTDGTGVDPVVQLRYSREQKTSRFTVSLSQSVTSDSNNEERINSSLNANYDYRINNHSSLGLDVGFFNRNELGASQNDSQSFDIGLSYRHDLTKDWGLVSGYTYRKSTSDSRPDRTANTIYVGLQRSFTWNP